MDKENIKNEYFKFHYGNKESIVPADIADWWIDKIEQAIKEENLKRLADMYLMGKFDKQMQIIDMIEKSKTKLETKLFPSEKEKYRNKVLDKIIERITYNR